MAELTLEPLAVRQHWRLSQAAVDWERFLAEYLESLAQACVAGGARLIGHIKAIALFPNHEFVQVSVVSARHPASIQGKVPAGISELTLSLNVIVYGLEFQQVQQITRETALHLAERWNGEVTNQEFDPHPHSDHSFHHP